MYLAACEFTMADKSRHHGFATPSFEPDDMRLIQPQVFSPSVTIEVRAMALLKAHPARQAENGEAT
jgi:hypothetical protein